MGVHHLIRNHADVNARLPLKITFNVGENANLESDYYFSDYKQIGTGTLRYIGIDGSVFIHSNIIADQIEEGKYRIHFDKTVNEIVKNILNYVEIIIIFFNLFNNPVEKTQILIHFVVDGKPPVVKNRQRQWSPDPYTQMNTEEKKKIQAKIVENLAKYIEPKENLLFLSNVSTSNRGEGELELYSVSNKIIAKHNNKNVKTVIISSDSDVIAMMVLDKNPNLVAVCPSKQGPHITNFELMMKGLGLTPDQLSLYTILHFIFFGSDYNLGLMTTPTDSKQKVIYDAVKSGETNINEIARKCKRNKKKDVSDKTYLNDLKPKLIYEAICAVLYYKKRDESFLLKHSPLLYRQEDVKKCVPLISFS